MKIAISAGHGSKIRGASDIIDEVDEARRVCQQVCSDLFDMDVPYEGPYFDNVSTSQNENLQRIVDWHNTRTRDLDVSVHFNANQHTSAPVGTECWYMTQEELAAEVATGIARASDLIDRGEKYSNGLYFLKHTSEPAILIEVCFVDSVADVKAYQENFRAICQAIAATLAGDEAGGGDQPDPTPDLPVTFKGACSWFGGPDDDGVAPNEGLAFLYKVSDAPELFLPTQPPGTSGLARRLDPDKFYVAARWNYDVTSKDMLRDQTVKALVRAGDREFLAQPADWGPNENTGRAADLSPGLLEALGLETDDEVEVIYPAPTQPVAKARVDIATTGPVEVYVNGQPVARDRFDTFGKKPLAINAALGAQF